MDDARAHSLAMVGNGSAPVKTQQSPLLEAPLAMELGAGSALSLGTYEMMRKLYLNDFDTHVASGRQLGSARPSSFQPPRRTVSTKIQVDSITAFGVREDPYRQSIQDIEHPAAIVDDRTSETGSSSIIGSPQPLAVAEAAGVAGVLMRSEMEEAGILPPGYEKILGTLHRVALSFVPRMDDELALKAGDQVVLK
ncbi:hypothetical protein HDU67_008163 [Dinochytrium kinnereticum]|nr:hypothetical protein HDU67_008163 [Dinochytrium kinnereticum]